MYRRSPHNTFSIRFLTSMMASGQNINEEHLKMSDNEISKYLSNFGKNEIYFDYIQFESAKNDLKKWCSTISCSNKNAESICLVIDKYTILILEFGLENYFPNYRSLRTSLERIQKQKDINRERKDKSEKNFRTFGKIAFFGFTTIFVLFIIAVLTNKESQEEIVAGMAREASR